MAALAGAARAATPFKVSVTGFASASLLGMNGTEESLTALLIEELIAQGGFAVIESADADPSDPPHLLRATVTKFEAKSGGGLDIGGFGGLGAGVGGEKFDLAVSLRLLDPATKQVLALATGEGSAKGRSLRGGVQDDDGRTLGAERKLSPGVEKACRTAIKQAVERLAAATAKLA